MVRIQAAKPNGLAVQQLEVLVRTAVFESANQVVAYLLQQAADRIDAAYQPKPGWQRKGRVALTLDCIFGFFTLERDYYYHPGKQQGQYGTFRSRGFFIGSGVIEAGCKNHRRSLQTSGHVLGGARSGKYPGAALYPCQPPTRPILENATQRALRHQ